MAAIKKEKEEVKFLQVHFIEIKNLIDISKFVIPKVIWGNDGD